VRCPVKNVPMTVGEWLRRTREEHGWSQDELGFRSHVSPRLIGRYERGEGEPSHQNLEKITAALEVPLPWVTASKDSHSARERSSDVGGIVVLPDDLALAGAVG
jgi:transcriptional regulator with XRE-family HTH domain